MYVSTFITNSKYEKLELHVPKATKIKYLVTMVRFSIIFNNLNNCINNLSELVLSKKSYFNFFLAF